MPQARPLSLHGTTRPAAQRALGAKINLTSEAWQSRCEQRARWRCEQQARSRSRSEWVRASANQRPSATRDVPLCARRPRSGRRSRSEWGASARESAPAGDERHSMVRLPNKGPVPFAKRMGCERPRISARPRHETFRFAHGAQGADAVREANGVRAPANQRPPTTQDVPIQNGVQGVGADSRVAERGGGAANGKIRVSCPILLPCRSAPSP